MAKSLYYGVLYPPADIRTLAHPDRPFEAIGPAFSDFDSATAALDEELPDIRERGLPVEPFVIEVDASSRDVIGIFALED
jgi:hypothetical protein